MIDFILLIVIYNAIRRDFNMFKVHRQLVSNFNDKYSFCQLVHNVLFITFINVMINYKWNITAYRVIINEIVVKYLKAQPWIFYLNTCRILSHIVNIYNVGWPVRIIIGHVYQLKYIIPYIYICKSSVYNAVMRNRNARKWNIQE